LQQQVYWLSQQEREIAAFPIDWSAGENTVASIASVSIFLTEDLTRILLQQVPNVYHTQINEVLLTALAQTLSNWTGEKSCRIVLEGHGREELQEGLDLSRTVGWFTSLYPLALTLPPEGETDPGVALKAIKEQVRQVPQQGIGYGALHYLKNGEEQKQAVRENLAEISWNYLGQFDQVFEQQGTWWPSYESSGPVVNPLGRRVHLLEVVGSISGGQLHLVWSYSSNCHRKETIERLAQSYLQTLQDLIAHCQSQEAGGYTPSDFPEAEVSQKELDSILKKLKQKKVK